MWSNTFVSYLDSPVYNVGLFISKYCDGYNAVFVNFLSEFKKKNMTYLIDLEAGICIWNLHLKSAFLELHFSFIDITTCCYLVRLRKQ